MFSYWDFHTDVFILGFSYWGFHIGVFILGFSYWGFHIEVFILVSFTPPHTHPSHNTAPPPARPQADHIRGILREKGINPDGFWKGCVNTGGETRPGDWMCTSCNVNVFATRDKCYKCGQLKPAGSGFNPPPPNYPMPQRGGMGGGYGGGGYGGGKGGGGMGGGGMGGGGML